MSLLVTVAAVLSYFLIYFLIVIRIWWITTHLFAGGFFRIVSSVHVAMTVGGFE